MLQHLKYIFENTCASLKIFLLGTLVLVLEKFKVLVCTLFKYSKVATGLMVSYNRLTCWCLTRYEEFCVWKCSKCLWELMQDNSAYIYSFKTLSTNPTYG